MANHLPNLAEQQPLHNQPPGLCTSPVSDDADHPGKSLPGSHIKNHSKGAPSLLFLRSKVSEMKVIDFPSDRALMTGTDYR